MRGTDERVVVRGDRDAVEGHVPLRHVEDAAEVVLQVRLLVKEHREVVVVDHRVLW